MRNILSIVLKGLDNINKEDEEFIKKELDDILKYYSIFYSDEILQLMSNYDNEDINPNNERIIKLNKLVSEELEKYVNVDLSFSNN